MTVSCFCGCADPVQGKPHHVITQQELGKIHRSARKAGRATRPLSALLADQRNLVPVAFVCHGSHHAFSQPYELAMLPDSAFEFAAEVMGAERAHGWLARRYVGEDARLDALLGMVVA